MTKAQLIDRIKFTAKAQHDAIQAMHDSMDECMDDVNMAVLVNSMLGISTTIADTMTNLSLILCEMLLEATIEKVVEKIEPMKGEHTPGCFKDCLCLSCANDHGSDRDRHSCCVEHGARFCTMRRCPDYVKEK